MIKYYDITKHGKNGLKTAVNTIPHFLRKNNRPAGGRKILFKSFLIGLKHVFRPAADNYIKKGLKNACRRLYGKMIK